MQFATDLADTIGDLPDVREFARRAQMPRAAAGQKILDALALDGRDAIDAIEAGTALYPNEYRLCEAAMRKARELSEGLFVPARADVHLWTTG